MAKVRIVNFVHTLAPELPVSWWQTVPYTWAWSRSCDVFNLWQI